MVPWEPLFVKCHGGSPDTGTGEDEFSFRAVSLLTPLILGVLMMNFFLFFTLFIFTLMPPPTALKQRARNRTDGALRGRSGLMRIQSLPTLKSHDCTCKEKPWFPLGDTDAMMLVFPVEGEEERTNRPFTRKTTLTLIHSSAKTMFNHKITGGQIPKS